MKDKARFIFIVFVVVIFVFVYAENKAVIDNKLMDLKTTFLTDDVLDSVKLRVDGNLNIYYFDVGQADSILIENSDKYMLIDAGNNADSDKIIHYFKSLGIERFEHVIATHAHEDHIGAMDDVIDNFEINNFYMPDVVTTSKTFEDMIEALENNNVSITIPKIKDMIVLGGCSFDVLHVGDEGEDLNDTSIVLRGLYGDTSFLFMGDATTNVEKKIFNENIKSDVLKVGHHGSKYSSMVKFLNKVSPKYSIISVGSDNSYDHPNKSTITKLTDVGSKIYRTDIDGTIFVSSNGENININTLDVSLNG